MSWLLAIIAVLFFGVFNFSADRSDQQPNTVESMYERSESKLCGKKRALRVTSRKVVWLFPEQLWFDFVPFFHRLQGRLTAQG